MPWMTTFAPGVSESPGFGFSMISTTPWAGEITQEAAARSVGVCVGTAWAAGSADAAVLRAAVSSPTIVALIPQAHRRGACRLRSDSFTIEWKITLRPPVVARSPQRTLVARNPADERSVQARGMATRSSPPFRLVLLLGGLVGRAEATRPARATGAAALWPNLSHLLVDARVD